MTPKNLKTLEENLDILKSTKRLGDNRIKCLREQIGIEISKNNHIIFQIEKTENEIKELEE